MATQITASFEVASWNEEPVDERIDGAKLTNARVTKSYSGEIEGDSVTDWLMAYAEDGSASFVGLERINGTIAGRSGSLVVQHLGTYRDGTATAELTAVAGCGGGELGGVTGTGDFTADPAGRVRLELAFRDRSVRAGRHEARATQVPAQVPGRASDEFGPALQPLAWGPWVSFAARWERSPRRGNEAMLS